MVNQSRRSNGETRSAANEAERLMSAQDLADYLEVPVATIYAWRYRGQGPRGFRAGRHLRYRWHEIEAWIVTQLQESPLD